MAEMEAFRFWLELNEYSPVLALLALILFTIIVALVVGYRLTKGNNKAIGDTKEEVVNLVNESREQTDILREVVYILSQSTSHAHRRIDDVEKVQAHHGKEIATLKNHVKAETIAQ